MAKIKIWGAFDKEPLHTIVYDSNDIDSIAIAEQERKDFIDKVFKEQNLKEVYVMGYENDDSELHTSKIIKNHKYADAHVFIVSITAPIVHGVYKTKESAQSHIMEYIRNTHSEFQNDEIFEIVDELMAVGTYTLGKTHYYFSSKARL